MAVGGLVSLWRRFWFTAVPVRRVAFVRVVACVFAFVDVATSGYITRAGEADRVFSERLPIFRVVQTLTGDAAASSTALRVVQIVLLVTLACAAVGLGTRLALLAAAPLYAWWWASEFGFALAGAQGRLAVIVTLGVLAIAPAGGAYSVDAALAKRRGRAPAAEVDEVAGWAVRFATVFVVISYVGSACTKVKTAGIGWPWGGALDSALLHHGSRLGLYLARSPWLVHLLALTALVWLATAWVLLLPRASFLTRRLRDVWVVYGAAAVLLSYVLLGLSFFGWALLSCLAYDLERAVPQGRMVLQRVAERLRSSPATAAARSRL
ncbi:MAG TPA: hypothetical protein VJT84_14095 [Gaiellaceae bacterium]|nr:hypothetical protein [Gaiellaceae bacterium]